MDKPNFGYSDPVARLLAIGDPRELPRKPDWRGGIQWPDYVAEYGLRPEDAPELIRMATDDNLNQAMSDTTEVWAPLHSWRALGQLKVVAAVEPLLSLFHRVDDENDDWVGEDLPEVMGMIGPEAIPAVSAYLADSKNLIWARVAASSSLENIANRNPEAREDCISALSETLKKYAQNDELLNGELVASLAELKAVEAAPLVEESFKADRVDESIMGDWEDFQVEVGLLERRITDQYDEPDFSSFPFRDEPGPQRQPSSKAEKKEKSRRKQAKESRKKNRKKKK